MIKDGLLISNYKLNATGVLQATDTLTAVAKKLSEQKLYQIPFADYVPTVIGNGAYGNQIQTWRSFVTGEGFEAGIMGNASNDARHDLVNAQFDSLFTKITNWSKGTEYNIFEMEQAARASNLFSLIEAKEKARMKEWTLGIQKIAFKGWGSNTGLLNNSGLSADSSNLAKRLYALSAAELNTWAGVVLGLYRARCNYTAYPNMFVIPENDYNGLCNFPDATYPVKTRIEILTDIFKTVTMNQGFKILPCAYCDKANYDTTNNAYLLYNNDEESIRFDLPLDYTTTAFGTGDNFTFRSVGMGQFTPVTYIRPLEAYLFTNTAT